MHSKPKFHSSKLSNANHISTDLARESFEISGPPLRLMLGTLLSCSLSSGWSPALTARGASGRHARVRALALDSPPVFSNSNLNTDLKLQLTSLAAALDRGQSYNPTSSDAYAERMGVARSILSSLIAASPPLPTSLDALDGEWELVVRATSHLKSCAMYPLRCCRTVHRCCAWNFPLIAFLLGNRGGIRQCRRPRKSRSLLSLARVADLLMGYL